MRAAPCACLWIASSSASLPVPAVAVVVDPAVVDAVEHDPAAPVDDAEPVGVVNVQLRPSAATGHPGRFEPVDRAEVPLPHPVADVVRLQFGPRAEHPA